MHLLFAYLLFEKQLILSVFCVDLLPSDVIDDFIGTLITSVLGTDPVNGLAPYVIASFLQRNMCARELQFLNAAFAT